MPRACPAAPGRERQALPIFGSTTCQVGPVDIRPPAAVGSRGRPFRTLGEGGHDGDDDGQDKERLAEMGYKQELDRSWSGFQNFAISFTIISVLAGCFTTYYQAWTTAARSPSRGAGRSSRPSSSSSRSACPSWRPPTPRRAASTGGGEARRPGWGWITGWFNLLGLIAILASVDYFAGQFLSVVLGLYNVDVLGLNFGDSAHALREVFVLFAILLVLHVILEHPRQSTSSRG